MTTVDEIVECPDRSVGEIALDLEKLAGFKVRDKHYADLKEIVLKSKEAVRAKMDNNGQQLVFQLFVM